MAKPTFWTITTRNPPALSRILSGNSWYFCESGWKISVSQMETVGLESFKDISESLAKELDWAREEAACQFSCLMVTDITSSTSLLLCSGEEKIIEAISYPKIGENLFEMVGVLSRKKQMMPYLVDLIRGL